MIRTFIATALLCASIATANAQVTTPRSSPNAEFSQEVGLTDINVTYSRPSKKGRAIFGDLVPYGQVWRTGANMNTVVEFSTDVVINDNDLPKGKYALYTIPGEKSWEVIFYTDYNNGGLPSEWDEAKVAVKTSVKSQKRTASVETFRISVDHLTSSSAQLVLAWDLTEVAVPIQVPSEEMTMASIEKTMAGPSASDYAAAAQYYFDEKKDMNQAYEWMNKALSMVENEPFWWLRRKALIAAELGKKEEAIAAAKASLKGAEAAGNDDYVRMNKQSLAEWSK